MFLCHSLQWQSNFKSKIWTRKETSLLFYYFLSLTNTIRFIFAFKVKTTIFRFRWFVALRWACSHTNHRLSIIIISIRCRRCHSSTHNTHANRLSEIGIGIEHSLFSMIFVCKSITHGFFILMRHWHIGTWRYSNIVYTLRKLSRCQLSFVFNLIRRIMNSFIIKEGVVSWIDENLQINIVIRIR